MSFNQLQGLSFDDVLLEPQCGIIDSRRDADISVDCLDLDIPVFSAPMPSVASIDLLREITRLGGAGVVNRMGTSLQEQLIAYKAVRHENCYMAVGLDVNVFEDFVQNKVTKFVLDVAHGHSERAIDFISWATDMYPNITLIAGNVATFAGASELRTAGADAVKVGIGPGSVCTTRKVTGFGVPQLGAIEQCASGFVKVPIIADGGIRGSGDIVKALAAGADAVMIGSLFAQSVEANNGGLYYGCASKRVNGHHAPEGTEKIFEEFRPLEEIVKELMWGVRSAISYSGGTDLDGLRDNATWIRLTGAGRVESKLS